MANQYYQSAFKSDIFNQTDKSNQIQPEKTIFSHANQPKDNVSSLSSYMQTEPKPQDIHHKKFFSSKRSDVLNVYEQNAPSRQRDLGPKHHLSKSQVEMGNYDMSSYNIHKSKAIATGKYPKEESSYQRKMEEFYGKDYAKYSKNNGQHRTTRNVLQNELFEKNCNSYPYSLSTNSLFNSTPSNNKGLFKRIKVNVREVDKDDEKKNAQPFEKKVNFLKSNIFNDPNIDKINTNHNIPQKEMKIDTHPIKSTKRAHSMEMDMIFDWKESKNEIWLSKYAQDKSGLSAKERKLTEIYGSLDQISLENTKESLLEQFYENKKEIESKAIEHYKGRGADAIKRQCENMSSLNGSDFYQKNYKLNSKPKDRLGKVHNYEIDNINESDIKQVKKCFINNGIHVYNTSLRDFKINSLEPGKIAVKIRENVNDNNFADNLSKAKEELKKEKGLELNPEMKPTRSYFRSIPYNLEWNDIHLHDYVKNRYEDSIEPKTHIKGYGKNINKKEKVTSIPYNLRYKNTLCKKNY